MYSLIAVIISLALFVILMRCRLRIGRAMILGALALACLLRVTPFEMYDALCLEWRELPFTQTTPYLLFTVAALLMLVNVLGLAMQQTGVADRLVPSLRGLFRSRRAGLAAIPLMMGMLPTPGGIMLSAPMVRAPGDTIGIDRPRLAAINFYFRHQWESIWPLFPAVPLVQGILGISAFRLISHNLAIPIAGIIGGVICLLIAGIPARTKADDHQPRHIWHNLRDFLHGFWPIAFTGILYTGLNVPPAVGLIVATVAFFLIHKVPLRRWPSICRKAAEPDFALMICGALLFKLNLEAAGAVPDIVAFLRQLQMPTPALVFALPFIVGFTTGLTMPTIAITFPLLIEFIGKGADARMGLEVLGFAGVLCGLFISPVHLCLPLSASYFEAPFSQIVRHLILPTIIVAAAAVLMAMIF